MNTTVFLTGVLTYFLLMLTMTYTLTLSDAKTADEHHELTDQPSVLLPNRIHSIYRNHHSIFDDIDKHELERRRFNAWAGKRALMARRRFNSWAG
ncbi:unnamed protein product [Rotaria magnacalcarata]|uniref:Uncharacterized protein n=1 Tax=Rotaria magnacalcarata TaxID=392030 RepID=A0A818YM55_9BILA|nr:unnamed protein product [Rotaria magnacalcarata]CAF1482967.1 unnamed protein product [Rotaria magnacalcarata]CAF1977634.1 unnamed protein product [Rotaria magnacalcarata]CAF2089693.1 unnamed protein product [Rotaria magnacalcarata]CAF2108075.1 unnamed protein product [Rotaria magnacalcarata]